MCVCVCAHGVCVCVCAGGVCARAHVVCVCARVCGVCVCVCVTHQIFTALQGASSPLCLLEPKVVIL